MHLTVFAGQRSTMTSARSDDFMTAAFVHRIPSSRCLCLSSWFQLSGTTSVGRTLNVPVADIYIYLYIYNRLTVANSTRLVFKQE